jgi:hypothetical protein
MSLGPALKNQLSRSGLYTLNREKRFSCEVVESVFKENQTKKLSAQLPEFIRPNIFPVTGLALILLILFNVNRSRKLRGNLRRIFFYPHGFFMELRDNRKVSNYHTLLLILVSITTIGIVCASIAFHFRNNSLFDEFLNLVTGTDIIKSNFIWLTWHPAYFLMTSIVLLFVFYLGLVILLKISSIIMGQRLPMSQFATLVSWVGACFLWLLPIVPIYYRIINQTTWGMVALIVFSLFIVWFVIRLFRAVKIVFALSLVRAVLFGIVFSVIIFGGLAWYYDKTHAFFDYLPFYWKAFYSQMSTL